MMMEGVVGRVANYIGVGQFELGRAELVSLEDEALRRQVRDKLLDILGNGCRLQLSPSVPSLAHLEWLLSGVLEKDRDTDTLRKTLLAATVLVEIGGDYGRGVLNKALHPTRYHEQLLHFASNVELASSFMVTNHMLGLWLLESLVQWFGHRDLVRNILKEVVITSSAYCLEAFSLVSKYLKLRFDLMDETTRKMEIASLFTKGFRDTLGQFRSKHKLFQVILRDWWDQPEMTRVLKLFCMNPEDENALERNRTRHFMRKVVDDTLGRIREGSVGELSTLSGKFGENVWFRALIVLASEKYELGNFKMQMTLLRDYLLVDGMVQWTPSDGDGNTLRNKVFHICYERYFIMETLFRLSNSDEKLATKLFQDIDCGGRSILSVFVHNRDLVQGLALGERDINVLVKSHPKNDPYLQAFHHDVCLMRCLRVCVQFQEMDFLCKKETFYTFSMDPDLEEPFVSLTMEALLSIFLHRIGGMEFTLADFKDIVSHMVSLIRTKIPKVALVLEHKLWAITEIAQRGCVFHYGKLLAEDPKAYVSLSIRNGLYDIAKAIRERFKLPIELERNCEMVKALVNEPNALLSEENLYYILDYALLRNSIRESMRILEEYQGLFQTDKLASRLRDDFSRLAAQEKTVDSMTLVLTNIIDPYEAAHLLPTDTSTLKSAVKLESQNIKQQFQHLLAQLEQKNWKYPYLQTIATYAKQIESLFPDKVFLTSRKTLSLTPHDIFDTIIDQPLKASTILQGWGLDIARIIAQLYSERLKKEEDPSKREILLRNLEIAERAVVYGPKWRHSGQSPMNWIAQVEHLSRNPDTTLPSLLATCSEEQKRNHMEALTQFLDSSSKLGDPMARYLALLPTLKSKPMTTVETSKSVPDIIQRIQQRNEDKMAKRASWPKSRTSTSKNEEIPKETSRQGRNNPQFQFPLPKRSKDDTTNPFSATSLIRKGLDAKLGPTLVYLLSEEFERLPPLKRKLYVQQLRNDLTTKLKQGTVDQNSSKLLQQQLATLSYVDIWRKLRLKHATRRRYDIE